MEEVKGATVVAGVSLIAVLIMAGCIAKLAQLNLRKL